MFGSGAKALLDVFYLIFIIFMTASVSYAGIGSFSSSTQKLDAATILGLVSLILAAIYKLLDALSPVLGFCKTLSLNAFGLVLIPILSTLLAAIDIIMYCVECNGIGDHTWFALTFIAVVASICATISSFLYFRRPVKKGLLN